MEMSSSSNPSWDDLPNEILEKIGKHLRSRIDVFRFRAVSSSWRSVVSLSYRPNRFPPPPPHSIFYLDAFLAIVTICRLQHHTGGPAVLVKVIERRDLKLISPLSSDFSIYSSPKTINLLDFRLTEIQIGYRLSQAKKVVLFYDFGILAIFNLGILRFLGSEDKVWTGLGNEENNYDDIINHNNQIYVINSLGTIYWVDKGRNLVQYSPPLDGIGHFKNIVVSDNQFYIVDHYIEEEGVAGEQPPRYQEPGIEDRRRTVDMKVYKLDEDWGTWVEVKSLEDRVFVLGKEVCVSICVKDFPGCQGNCIYFVDTSDPGSEFQNVGGSVKRFVGRVFRFDNGSITLVECSPAYKLFSIYMNWPLAISSGKDSLAG